VGHHFTHRIDVNTKEVYAPGPSSWESTQRLACGMSEEEEPSSMLSSVLSTSPTLHEAVIATLVFIHENVRSAGGGTGGSTGGGSGTASRTASSSNQKTHKFVSPRDYIDFIKHVVEIHKEKRNQLEEQQLHLNIGLDKLKDTAVQVSELQQGKCLPRVTLDI
tara:strand:+ start:139 stop:627 length:489 start_codon:yes stop_codon:yes gene_type:complete